MLSVPVIPADEVPPGSVREVTVEGRSYAICNANGTFYAVSGDCPHRDGPLGHGALHEYTLVCPWHLWEFDIRTGQSPVWADCSIATYPTSLGEDGMVRITLPNA